MSRIQALWSSVSLRGKIRTLICSIIAVFLMLILILSVLLSRQQQAYGRAIQINIDIARFMHSFRQERIALTPMIYPSIPLDDTALSELRDATDAHLRQVLSAPAMDNTHLMYRHVLDSAMQGYRKNERELVGRFSNDTLELPVIADYYRLMEQADYIAQYANEMLAAAAEAGASQMQKFSVSKRFMLGLMLLLILLCAFVLTRVMRLLRRSVVEPVLLLNQAADQIARGLLDQPDLPVQGSDELAALTRNFDRMKHRLSEAFAAWAEKAQMEQALHRQAIQQAETEKLLERTRYQQLQSQMKPHFLFNCLNTVSALADLETAPRTVEMTARLAELMRYIIDDHSDLVLIARELDMVQSYLAIQQLRFGDRIRSDIVRCPLCETALIPKFLIQPIVENSMVHGLSPKPSGGRIRIRIYARIPDAVTVYILDNGVGFENNIPKSGGPDRPASIGLDNVRKRLLMYDPEASLSIRSRVGRGTAVRIHLHVMAKHIRGTEAVENDQNSAGR